MSLNSFLKYARCRNIILTVSFVSTEEVIAKVHAASPVEVDKAVQAAHSALHAPEWNSMSGTDRGILMARLADLMQLKSETFATIDAWDSGKTYTEALTNDLVEAVTTLRYYAGWADKIHGQTTQLRNKLAYTLRQPVGVVAQIIPWNYPLSMATWKLGPALACGNTVVLKSAEQTPLSVLVLGQLIRQAGFPPGVVNIISGHGPTAGAALAGHPLVDKVAFTGSTATATKIMALAAASLKNITLETGGKSPLIVFSDADLEQAVKWSHMGIMSNQGQICTATSRILVQQDVYETFVTQFVREVEAVSKIGNQWDSETYQGPQVSELQRQRILAYIAIGKSEATVATGGEAVPGRGYFVQPTVFIDVKRTSRIWREEIFGPVVCIMPFDDEVAAIDEANDSQYGLGAAVFSTNLERAHRVAAALESGMVWINSTQDCDPRVPFGGVKQSGIGRELGEAGLDAYSEVKTIHINMGNQM